MRVLSVGNMYPPHHLGGYEITWRSAVRHLRSRGHEVRVLTTDWRRPDATDAEEDPDVHRELRWYWRDHEFPPVSALGRVRLERANAATLERHLADLRPEVVNWWAMGGMSLSLVERVRRRGIPAVGVVGDDWMAYGPKTDAWMRALGRRPRIAPLAERLAGVPARVDLSAAATWLFNSDSTRRRSETRAGPLAAAEVAHPGIDTDLFSPRPRPEWRWRLLVVGRIDDRKGVEVAVRALEHLPEEARLTVLGAGDEAYLARLRALTAALGLSARVEFAVRPRKDLPAAYADADALLFPVQWEEPWGLVPLEAMAVGAPVVASGTGGSAEYLRDAENCLLYSPRDDPAALAAALARLAGDAGLRGRLSAAGLELAPRFSEAAYNEAIERALGAAVAAKGSDARPRERRVVGHALRPGRQSH